MNIDEYEKCVAKLNCIHADKHGVCEMSSDDETKEYCVLGICPDYKERIKEDE